MKPASNGVEPVSDIDLASRLLSFFLWSSLPDDQLLDVAERGKLRDPQVLEAQVKRMLADPRSDARGKWLLENVLGTPPPQPPKNVPRFRRTTGRARRNRFARALTFALGRAIEWYDLPAVAAALKSRDNRRRM